MKIIGEDHQGIRLLTLDDGRMNALNRQSCDRLVKAIEDAGRQAQALVLTGNGTAFCAGGDLELLERWSDWEPPRRTEEVAEGPQRVSHALLAAPVPTVAAIDGWAVGAGLDLSLVCDLRLASTSARFREGYVHVGVLAGDGAGWLLPRHVGMGAALDLLLTGRTVDAEEARSLGLVGRVVEPAILQTEALEVARQLAAHPRQGYLAIRRSVYESAVESFGAHLRTAALQMGSLGGTEEHRQAVAGLRDRRPS